MYANTIKTGLLIIVSVLTVAWGVQADEARYQKAKTAPEFIRTSNLEVPAEFATTSGGKFPRESSYWAMIETQDWLLLNGPRGTDLCAAALSDFGHANAPSEAMSPAQVRALAAGYRAKSLELKVYIPRFASKPDLAKCVGFDYDSVTKQLTVGAKKVAYLAAEQPRLTATTR